MNETDDWLIRSLRNDVANLHQQQDVTVTLYDHGWRNDDGTPGISELLTDTTLLHVEWPAANGRSLSAPSGWRWMPARARKRPLWHLRVRRRTCGQASAGRSRSTGRRLARRALADLGLTQGFEINNVYGGITGRGDAGPRPVAHCVAPTDEQFSLSHGGSRDPVTGEQWAP